jgi:hypothetical protein
MREEMMKVIEAVQNLVEPMFDCTWGVTFFRKTENHPAFVSIYLLPEGDNGRALVEHGAIFEEAMNNAEKRLADYRAEQEKLHVN